MKKNRLLVLSLLFFSFICIKTEIYAQTLSSNLKIGGLVSCNLNLPITVNNLNSFTSFSLCQLKLHGKSPVPYEPVPYCLIIKRKRPPNPNIISHGKVRSPIDEMLDPFKGIDYIVPQKHHSLKTNLNSFTSSSLCQLKLHGKSPVPYEPVPYCLIIKRKRPPNPNIISHGKVRSPIDEMLDPFKGIDYIVPQKHHSLKTNLNSFTSSSLCQLKLHGKSPVPLTVNNLHSSKSFGLCSIAYRYTGVPYWRGGLSPRGFDCSGFVKYVYGKAGFHLPRTVDSQFLVGRKIKKSSLEPGDLVFFTTYVEGPSHVGIYTGYGKFIHASYSAGVKIDSLSNSYYIQRYIGARRII